MRYYNDVLMLHFQFSTKKHRLLWDPLGSWTLRGTVRIPVKSSYRADKLSGAATAAPTLRGIASKQTCAAALSASKFLYSSIGVQFYRDRYDLHSSILDTITAHFQKYE